MEYQVLISDILIYFADYPTRIANCQTVWRNVFRNNTACTDYAVCTNRYARQHHHPCADPDVVTDMNRMRVFKTLNPPGCIHCMFFCYNTYIGCNKYVVSNGNLSAVHEFAVDVQEKIIAHRSVIPICTEKRLLHDAVSTGTAKQSLYGSLTSFTVKRVYVVIVI